ncbi:MAG TPA: M23 family metallopeptidase [Catenuloplanes sp.]|jgi:murein DD-endopeptidase MepM/ murein hydrolase activator NlpD
MVNVPGWYRSAARLRGVGALVGPVLIIVGWLLGVLGDPPPVVVVVLTLIGFTLLVLAMGAAYLPGAPAITPTTVTPPVRGRWIALNSPATKRPSHGTHGHGQTFAIDLVYEPDPGSRPAFGSGAGFRPPTDFPGFGRPLYAPADGTVVRVRDRDRDHRSRSSWPAYFYLMVEGMVRELAGSRFLLGNHLVLDLGGGVYAVLAHLQRGSVSVAVGDRVSRGQDIGRCGNSGNSSEPHVHFQLMDCAHPAVAAGLPFAFPHGIPSNSEALTLPGPA